MNAPAAGWNPDPTGRHQYRYWDGSTWTDDVSDDGVTAVDPVAGPGGEPTGVIDSTRQYAPNAGPQPGGFGPQPGPQQGYAPMYSSGQVPPAQPAKSGPSTGLIFGIAAAAVALIAGVAFVVASGGDDNDGDAATDQTSQSSDDTASDETPDDTSSDDTSEDTSEGDLGDIGEDPAESAFIEIMAAGMVEGSNGQITTEQAECAAQAVVDEIGFESIMEMGASGEDAFATASPEDQVAIFNAMTECIPTDVLIDMGVDGGEG